MKKTEDPLLSGPVPPPENGIVSVPWGYDPEEKWKEVF